MSPKPQLLPLAPSPSPIVLHGKMRQERVFASNAVPGGTPILDSFSHQMGSVSSAPMLHSAVPSSLFLSHQYATGDQAYPSRQPNPRRQPHRYFNTAPSISRASSSHEAPDLVSLFFFFSFVYYFVSCLPPWLTTCPTVAAATCHGPIQNRQNNDVLLPDLEAQLDFQI